jgi:hypothetical protein
VDEHVGHCDTHESPQVQSVEERQLEPNVLQAPDVAPPAPAPEEAPPVPVLVHVQPLTGTHCCSAYPEHVPNDVPVQLSFQTHPTIALHPWNENAVAHDCPGLEVVPPHVPLSAQPGLALQSAPERSWHGIGVPEQVPVLVPDTPFIAPLGFSFRPGQSLQAATPTSETPRTQRTSQDSLADILQLKRRGASGASLAAPVSSFTAGQGCRESHPDAQALRASVRREADPRNARSSVRSGYGPQGGAVSRYATGLCAAG